MKFATVAAFALSTLSAVNAGKHEDKKSSELPSTKSDVYSSTHEHHHESSTEVNSHTHKHESSTSKAPSKPPHRETTTTETPCETTTTETPCETTTTETPCETTTTETPCETTETPWHSTSVVPPPKPPHTRNETSEVPCESTTKVHPPPHYNSTSPLPPLPKTTSTWVHKNKTTIITTDCPTSSEVISITTKHFAPSNATTPVPYTKNGAGVLDSNVVVAGLGAVGALLL